MRALITPDIADEMDALVLEVYLQLMKDMTYLVVSMINWSPSRYTQIIKMRCPGKTSSRRTRDVVLTSGSHHRHQ